MTIYMLAQVFVSADICVSVYTFDEEHGFNKYKCGYAPKDWIGYIPQKNATDQWV